jgi:hypothetical protein
VDIVRQGARSRLTTLDGSNGSRRATVGAEISQHHVSDHLGQLAGGGIEVAEVAQIVTEIDALVRVRPAAATRRVSFDSHGSDI